MSSSLGTRPSVVALSLVTGLAGLGLGAAAFARTVTTDAAARSATLPYQGFLEQDGTPVSGTRDLVFELFAEEAPGGTPVWSEAHAGVAVLAGRFGVNLGDTTDLPRAALDGSRWLQVSVGGTPLSGRQVLGSVPFARRGAPGQDFAVDGTLSAAALTGGDITLTGSVTAGGNISAAPGFGYVPVGTILPWHRDVRGTGSPLPLPVGWVECSGGTVNDAASPLNGAAIPDLNNQVYSGGRGRYLRGGTVSGVTNPSTAYAGNGSRYTGNGGGVYYGACYGQFNDSENGTLISYSTGDNTLGNPYVQVTAMTVVYIMRVR
ncbi:MAG: hypothetical protein HY904_02525 [Deltaproteobacteria bacterium]|nr:hypothetical protein [Deltaproteobacteria bacterium]